MTSSGEDEEPDDFRRSTPIVVFSDYLHAFSKNLPPFTGRIVVIFCVLPVTISVAVFFVTAVLNFGIALIAQTISALVILVFFVPCLAMCLVSAIATAYLLHFSQSLYLRFTTTPRTSSMLSPLGFPKLAVEEKLKTL